MSKEGAFRLKVNDVFFMKDKIVFVGELETAAKFLGRTQCRLLIDGVERAQFEIEGESLFRPELQSVWTREGLDITRDELINGDSWLISP